MTDEAGYHVNVSSNMFIQNREDHEFVKGFKGEAQSHAGETSYRL